MARKRKKRQVSSSPKTKPSVQSNTTPEFVDISSGKVDKNDDFLHEYQLEDDTETATAVEVKPVSPRRERHRQKSNSILTFNNEEPVTFALKKMSFELFAICIFVLSFLLLLGGIQFIFSKLGNDSIENLAVSSLYQGTVSVDEISIAYSNDSELPDSVITSVANWYGHSVSADEVFSPLPFILKTQFNELLSNYDVSMHSNISNYSYITQIYTSLQQGNPVVVILATDTEISYAVVTSLDCESSLIKLTYSDGTSDTLTLDNFLLATRYTAESELSLTQKVLKFIGVYKVNTAFFINATE